MVFTRRGARTGADNTEPEPASGKALQKKPVRQAIAKSTKQQPRAKGAARDQKTDDTPVLIQEEEATSDKTNLTKRNAKAVTLSTKKNVVEAQASKNTLAPKRATKITRTRAVGTKSENLRPPEANAEGSKQTGQSRATRPTRATAAKDKSRPLSPKKITQVSKAPVRSAQTTTKKVVSKGHPQLKPSTQRFSSRTQAVSDENTDFDELQPKAQKGGIVGLDQTNPDPTLSNKRSVKQKLELEVDEESALSMNSSATTPVESPKIDSSQTEDAAGQMHDSLELDTSEDEADYSSTSEDELCGPKTPMKRCSPREAAKYMASIRKTPQPQFSAQLRTPLPRTGVFDSTRVVPQTQRPHYNFNVPLSEVRPLTVARGQKTAMVFPKLELFPNNIKNDAMPPVQEFESASNDEKSVSRLSKTVDCLAAEEKEKPFLPDHESSDINGDAEKMELTSVTDNPDHFGDESISNDLSYSPSAQRRQGTSTPQHLTLGTDIPQDDLFDESDLVQVQDIPSIAQRHDADAEGTAAVEDDDMLDDIGIDEETIDISRIEVQSDIDSDVDDSINNSYDSAGTPKPETVVWENLRQDVTLPLSLENNPWITDQVPIEPTERLSLAASFARAMQDQFHQAKQDEEKSAAKIELGRADLSPSCGNLEDGEKILNTRDSLDATVHLSEFINTDSLPETTQANSVEPIKATSDTAAANTAYESPVEPPMTPRNTRVTVVDTFTTPTKHAITAPEEILPRYAQQTISSASKKRQSLPALSHRTPVKEGARPYTSDGASMPRLRSPFARDIGLDVGSLPSVDIPLSPVHQRLNTPGAVTSTKGSTSSSTKTLKWQTSQPGTPIRRRNSSAERCRSGLTVHAGFPHMESVVAPVTLPAEVNATPVIANKERFPGLPSRDTYEELAETPVITGKERFPGLPSRDTYEELADTPATQVSFPKTPDTVRTAKRDRTYTPASRRVYREHAKTVVVPTRFRTPTQVQAQDKRPATEIKARSLLELASAASTPSVTPRKTPLKCATTTSTPRLPTLTPHPRAPLKDIMALVEVYTNDGSPASSPFIALLQRLGAKTTKAWTPRLTHVVFKGGAPNTLQRVRVHNKAVLAGAGDGAEIFCVNSRWVTDCDAAGRRMDEADEAYAVDVDDPVTRSSKRRRKSMEPAALINLGGNVVRDRKSSLGRARALGKRRSPSVDDDQHPHATPGEKENSADDGRDASSSPATPAYLAAPDSLVQQTAPMNRVRKLDFKSSDREAKRRRLTFWNGGA